MHANTNERGTDPPSATDLTICATRAKIHGTPIPSPEDAMKRRDFVSSITAAAAATALPAVARAGDGAPAIRDAGALASTVPATNIEIRDSYPPMEALPASAFEQRLERARALTRKAGGTVLLATSGATNFRYLVGDDFGRSERLIALLLPVDGEPLLIAPSFEVERVKRGVKVGSVRGWEESEDPFGLLRSSLGRARAAARILVEPKTEYWTAMAVARAMPAARLIDGSRVFEELRLIKSPEEIARMRRAIEITEDSIAATFDQLRAGMRDGDIARIVAAEHAKRGVGGGALVQLGAQSALPHGGTVDAELRDGMVVLIDGGCDFQGYSSDITRTRWFGDQPSERFREVYNLVHDAQSAAMERVKPGVAAQEIDRAARAVITRAGYGKNFTHRLGHGMGMDGHEAAYMVEGSTLPLQAGFVFSVEPGIYMLDQFGVRLEDDFTCTETGGELLSRRAPKV
jgi:Xaa-Pro dipeptidase